MLIQPCILRGPQTKKDKIRNGCLTPAFWGPRKKPEMLRYPRILGHCQTKKDNIRSGCLTRTFSGTQKRAEMLCHPAFLGVPNKKGQNQKTKPTLTITMMPLVSQSMGLVVRLDAQIVAMRSVRSLSAPPKRSPVGQPGECLPGALPFC